MSTRGFLEGENSFQDRRKGDRRKAIRRREDGLQEQVLVDRDRKLQSLLELGQLIGLDLQIDGMLVQIAQKAAEVMGAEATVLSAETTWAATLSPVRTVG